MQESIKDLVVDRIVKLFDDHEFKYSYDKSDGIFRLPFSLDSKLRETIVFLKVYEDYFLSLATIGVGADESVMANVYELLARINYSLLNGNFEVDPSTGNIRYKVFVKFGDVVPSEETIKDSVLIPVAMFQQFGDAFLAVIMNTSKPSDAIAEVSIEELPQQSISE